MGSPSGAGAKPTPSVDASDRKFYIRAAENGNDSALKDFDDALSAQRDRSPPRSPTPPVSAQPERVVPERAEDPSDQKFYNMAADRQNKIIDLENRAASLQRDIDALGTSGGYATEAMRAELNDTEAMLRSYGAVTPETAEDDGNQGLSDEELAAKYAPVLVLPDGQYDLPADPQDFIDNSRWRQDVPKWQEGVDIGWQFPPVKPKGDPEFGNNINADPSDDFTAADIGQRGGGEQFLDLADNRREIGSENAPFFYDVSRSDEPGEPTKVTYWFFYAYNDGPSTQNHEGDWERITLEFDPETNEPTTAIYSAHSNSHTKPLPFESLETHEDTGRPIVYVASGSHASYATPGAHQSELPLSFADDRTATDVNNDGVVDAKDGATIIDTGDNLRELEAQPFYPQTGPGVHWGEPGNADGLPIWGESSSGPRGPSAEKEHVELEEDDPGSPPVPGTTTTTVPPIGPPTTSPDRTPEPEPQPVPTPVGPPTGTTTTTPSPSPGTTTHD